MKKFLKGLMIFFLILAASGQAVLQKVYANGKYDIQEMTPEVKNALENRRSRFDQLKGFKSQGIIGENNRGYVELLKSDSSAASLVESENHDRKVIYTTIETQNNLSGALATIEKVFAQVQRDKADAGDQIQTEDGRWVAK